MRRIILAVALATAMIGGGWLGAQGASAQNGCYVNPGASARSCHYKADAGSGGYTVWTQGAWKVTQKIGTHKATVLYSSAKKSPSSGQFAKNPPKNAIVTLTLASSGGGAVGS